MLIIINVYKWDEENIIKQIKYIKEEEEDFHREYFGKKHTKRDWSSFKTSCTPFTKRRRHFCTLRVKKNTFCLSIEKNQREKIKKYMRQKEAKVLVTDLSYYIR